MYRTSRINALVPCYNEQSKIPYVVKRLQETGIIDEVVIVDDGSTDQSAEFCKNLGATVISLGSLLGVGTALRMGMDYCYSRCDIIVILAGNNKDEPREIPSLLDPIIDGTADIVQGSRFLKGGAYGGAMPNYRKWATRLHPWLFRLFTQSKITDSTNGFRAIKKAILSDPRLNLNQPWLNQYELEPYLLFKAIKLKYRIVEIPVTKIYPPKHLGYTKMRPWIDWWSILRPLFLLGFRLKT